MNMSGINSRSLVHRPSCRAMTILELLIVVGIIAMLSVLAVPAIKALTRSNTIASADRQLLDDLALARRRAINERSVVRVLFVPTNVIDMPLNGKSARNNKVLQGLQTGAQTRYALYAERSAGDQPGRHQPRYLTGWHTLPEGVFIPVWELDRLDKASVLFPTVEGDRTPVPQIAFDLNGSLVRPTGDFKPDEHLDLARGSVMFQRDDQGNVVFFDARQNPPGSWTNSIRISGLTGRARVEQPEIQ